MPQSIPDTFTHMEPREFLERGRKMASGLWEAVRDTPKRLKQVYTQPPASGPGGMKGIENTAGTGAAGLGQVWRSLKDLGK